MSDITIPKKTLCAMLRLFNGSFSPIYFNYSSLTKDEKSFVTKEEFEDIKHLSKINVCIEKEEKP